jgi:hypothetical protein
MKFSRLLLVISAAAGLLATAAPGALAQALNVSLVSPVAAAANLPQPDGEAALVQATLNRFDSALASRDGGQLQAVGIRPGDAKKWLAFFKYNPRGIVTDSCPASTLAVSAATANWDCTETATIFFGGETIRRSWPVHFTFTRYDSGWMISDRR